VSLGFLFSNRGWKLDIDGYLKRIDGITALSLGFLNPTDSGFHIGEQKVLGLDFYLKKDFKRLQTWISYSYGDVENRFEGLNNEDYFTSNTNIKHVFTLAGAYQIGKFELAGAWKWRTGKPYTKGSLSNNTSTINFNSINTENLPNYHRLDFSSSYSFNFSPKHALKGKFEVSLRNVYNRKNHLTKEYTGNNTLNDPIEAVDKFSLRFTPNFLFRLYF